MPLSETFDYSVIVERDTDDQNRWIGRARTVRGSSIHPGLLGRRPLFTLGNGHILLRSTESRLSLLTNAHFRRWGRPAASASLEVGDTPAAVMQQGDRLSFIRFGTRDLALTIMRNGSLVLGIGSLVGLPLGREIKLEDDIRIKEMPLYYLSKDFATIDDLESHVIWIDVCNGDLEAQLEAMRRTPRSKVVIVAMRGIENEKGERTVPDNVYDILCDSPNADSAYFYEVDPQFADKEAWLNYVKGLPRGRPKNLHVSIAIGHERIKLCEGEEAFMGDYYVRVEVVFRWGVPGELSSLAIARMSSALSKDVIVESARLVGERILVISR